MIERQARREEFLGHFGQAFALFMSAYVAPPPTPDVANPPSRNASKDAQQQVGEPSLLLSAARIKLRNLGDPHIAAALLEHILGISRPRGRDEEGPDVSAAARLLLTEAKRAIKAGMGRVLEYAGGPAHWPRRPLILPGNECTIVLAPDGEVPEAGVPVEAPRTPPQEGVGS